MSSRRVTLRELILADLVWIASAVSRPAAAELVRRGEVRGLAIAADDLARSPATIAAAASGAALALAEGCEEDAIRILADDCGLTAAAWVETTCAEQDVTLAPADLTGADLRGARRRPIDAPMPGWVVRDGVLSREAAA